MATDTQTVTLGTSGNFVGYSAVGSSYGSISDGTANAFGGAAWEGAFWDSVNKNFRIYINSTSALSRNFEYIEFENGDKLYAQGAAVTYISYITTTSFYWSYDPSPWGGSTSGTKDLIMEYGSISEATYGIKVLNSSGQSLTDTSDIVNTVITQGVFNAVIPSSSTMQTVTSSAITCSGMTTTNTADIGVLLFDLGPEPVNQFVDPVTINRGNGSFTITVRGMPGQAGTYPINYQAVIYGSN